MAMITYYICDAKGCDERVEAPEMVSVQIAHGQVRNSYMQFCQEHYDGFILILDTYLKTE